MLIGRTLLSRYQVTRTLGSGGFGETYLAVDEALPGQPTCVVKHLRPKTDDPELLAIAQRLFEQEAQALYKLGTHTQIPSLYAHFQEEGEFFLVQEFVDGHDLTQELGNRVWSEPDVLQLLQELLGILTVVHQGGVVHRDIKPPNIRRRRQDQQLVLIDFGAVKQIPQLMLDEQGQAQTSVMVGSPGYMPPEQARGYPRPASDVYAVGMLAIQALTGWLPTQIPVHAETLELQWHDAQSSAIGHSQQVSPGLANLLTQMVRYHFQDRYANAEDALQALSALTTQTDAIPATERVLVSPTPPPTETVIPTAPVPGSKRSSSVGYSLLTLGIGTLAAIISIGLYQLLTQGNLASNSSSTQPTVSSLAVPSPDSSTPQQPDLREQQELEDRLRQVEQENKTLREQQPPPQTPVQTALTSTNLVWRSKSNNTRLPNLNQICFGISEINNIQTVFGYGRAPLVGHIVIESPNTDGCSVGSTFRGQFSLTNNSSTCAGNVDIRWDQNDNAYLKWSITNLGSDCPVGKSAWQINTYPRP